MERWEAAKTVILTDPALALLMIHWLPVPFVFDGVDSFTLYFLRRAASLTMCSPARALNSLAWSWSFRAIERKIARHAALCVVPAEADARCILSACPQARVLVIPNGTSWIERPPVEPASPDSAPVIAYHGFMTWDPNRAGAAYLVKKVFPMVRRLIPRARLHIAGGPVSPALANLAREPGVRVEGFVPDLRIWLHDCHVYAMPMTQGSGVKNKLMEAMAAGLPIITNSLGAEALPDHCRNAVVIADGRRALAQCIVDLLLDPNRCSNLRARARSAAEREFAWSTFAARYREAIQWATAGYAF